jgi:predicted small lipoprotein YifL
MSKVAGILVSAPTGRLALAACMVAVLAGCGQKGPLFLPTGEQAAGRATLPQTLNRNTRPPVPATPASAPPTGTASPVRSNE